MAWIVSSVTLLDAERYLFRMARWRLVERSQVDIDLYKLSSSVRRWYVGGLAEEDSRLWDYR